MTMHTQPEPSNHPIWRVLRTHPLLALPIIGFIISVVSFFAVVIPAVVAGEGKAFATNMIAVWYVLGWMFLATLFVRTISGRQLVSMFFAGFFLSTVVSFILARPVLNRFGTNDTTMGLWVATVEELSKALPLLLTVWAYSRRHGQAHGISDLVLMGAAVGGGMTIHEDVLYGRTMSRGDSLFAPFDGPWGWLFPVIGTDWGATIVWHVGWGAIIGCGVGIASVYRTNRLFALCVAVAPVCVAIIDHAAWNSRGSLAAPLTALSVNHGLAFVIFLASIPLALIYDVVRQRHRPPHLPAPSVQMHRVALLLRGDPWRAALHYFALGHYRRGWISSAYDRATPHGLGSASHDTDRLLAWLRVIFPHSVSPVSAHKSSQ